MTANTTPLRRLAHLGLHPRFGERRVILAQSIADGDLEDLLQALPDITAGFDFMPDRIEHQLYDLVGGNFVHAHFVQRFAMHVDLVLELVARGYVLEALFVGLAPSGSVGSEQRTRLGSARFIADFLGIAAIGEGAAMVEGLFLGIAEGDSPG